MPIEPEAIIRLTPGEHVRVRLAGRDDDWTPAIVDVASSGNPSSVLLMFGGVVRTAAGFIANRLPLTIDYDAQTAISLFGDDYEIEVRDKTDLTSQQQWRDVQPPLDLVKAVETELLRRGILASMEYPGYIAIEVNGPSFKGWLNYGTANDKWDCDVADEDCNVVIKVIESDIPGDCTDVQRIADHIAGIYTQALYLPERGA